MTAGAKRSTLTCSIDPGGYPDRRVVRVMHEDRLAGVLFLPETEAVNVVELISQRMLQDRSRQIIALENAAAAIALALASHDFGPMGGAQLEAARVAALEAAAISESHISPRRIG